jgi:cytochrome c553
VRRKPGRASSPRVFSLATLLRPVLLAIPVCVLPSMASAGVPREFRTVRTLALQSTTTAPPAGGDIQAGTDLFTGRRRFQNGGPACASCHSVANLPFPSGGTMAPDLTHEYSKLGPEGMHYALRTLYFPAMNALFLKRQLTDREERDLAAFFQNADRARRSRPQTGVFGAVAVLGLLVLVGITGMSGRGRVHSVRRKLLKRVGLYRESR